MKLEFFFLLGDELGNVVQIGQVGDFALDQSFDGFGNTDRYSFDGIVAELDAAILGEVVDEDTTSDCAEFDLSNRCHFEKRSLLTVSVVCASINKENTMSSIQ